jgi:hypothetical protein
MGNIIWLASYPKSGNTWFRIFLSNLLGEEEAVADINKITSTNGIASGRSIFDEICGLEASDLSFEEIDNLRPELYRIISGEAKKTIFIKVHDAYTFLENNNPMFPPDATKGVIYIIRNPFDVAVSYANHAGLSLQESTIQMGNNTNKFSKSKRKLSSQLCQKLLTWSNHVNSWTKALGHNIHVMRYEDMKLAPLETFTAAVKFSGLNFEQDAILEAIQNSSFEKLQKQEKEKGFKERSNKAEVFFRKGQIGSWRKELSNEQANQIIEDHSEVLKKYNYLTQNGEIVF